MIAFLTSSPGGSIEENGKKLPCGFDNSNGFLDRLSSVWKEAARCLLICAEPDNKPVNDEMWRNLIASFTLSGLSISDLWLCDGRAPENVSLIDKSDVVILSGGHTLTQNRFFKRIGLKERMGGFDGIIIGISGGSMNCARTVYAQPEWEGDTTSPTYERFPEGLGLTDIMILPHYQKLKDETLDGLRLIEDIAFPDSFGRSIYALPDGSYVLLENGQETICGEAYLIRDGAIRRIN